MSSKIIPTGPTCSYPKGRFPFSQREREREINSVGWSKLASYHGLFGIIFRIDLSNALSLFINLYILDIPLQTCDVEQESLIG